MARANAGVEHPLGQYRYNARFDLDMDYAPTGALLTVLARTASTVERMPAIMDSNLSPDMGRMTSMVLGRNWLFAGSLSAGQRAAAVMSLIQSAKLNGHDPYGYLKDVLERLPTQPASRLQELLPHRWQPTPITH